MGEMKLTSGEAVRKATGLSWDEWGEELDAWSALERSHGEIVKWLMAERGVGSWWAQTVTVEYERARGLRTAGSGRNGLYTVSASKTVDAPLEELFRVVTDPGLRGRWLPDGLLTERTTQPRRSARFDWGDGTTRVNVGFVDKGTRAQIALAHERLPDQETADKTKQYWRDRLARLKQLLEA
jgi:hypothetical protein